MRREWRRAYALDVRGVCERHGREVGHFLTPGVPLLTCASGGRRARPAAPGDGAEDCPEGAAGGEEHEQQNHL
jgi:hypothetical protein